MLAARRSERESADSDKRLDEVVPYAVGTPGPPGSWSSGCRWNTTRNCGTSNNSAATPWSSEFKHDELERAEKVFELIAARSLQLQTERMAPTRVSLAAHGRRAAGPVEPYPLRGLALAILGGLLPAVRPGVRLGIVGSGGSAVPRPAGNARPDDRRRDRPNAAALALAEPARPAAKRSRTPRLPREHRQSANDAHAFRGHRRHADHRRNQRGQRRRQDERRLAVGDEPLAVHQGTGARDRRRHAFPRHPSRLPDRSRSGPGGRARREVRTCRRHRHDLERSRPLPPGGQADGQPARACWPTAHGRTCSPGFRPITAT